jgi:sulfur carrier protein
MNYPKYFQFNGNKYCTYNEISLLDLVQYFNYNSPLFVLEYNNFICNKNKWKNTFIKNNDILEIVTIVGGG